MDKIQLDWNLGNTVCQTSLDGEIKTAKHVPSTRSKIHSLQELITGQEMQNLGNPCDGKVHLFTVLSDNWLEQLHFHLRINWWNTQLFVEVRIPKGIALQINFIATFSKKGKLIIGGHESLLLWLSFAKMVQMSACCLEPANHHFTTCVMVQLDTLYCVPSNSNLEPSVNTSAEAAYANYWSINLLEVTRDGILIEAIYWTLALGVITWKVISDAVLIGAGIKIVVSSKQHLQCIIFRMCYTREVQVIKPSMRYSSYHFEVQFLANQLRTIKTPVNVLGHYGHCKGILHVPSDPGVKGSPIQLVGLGTSRNSREGDCQGLGMGQPMGWFSPK